jgi:soluble lytic murein transglycosylase
MSTRSATTRARPRRTPQRRRALLRRLTWLAVAIVVSAAVVAAIVAPGVDKAVQEIALPLRHEDIIRQQAADKGLDPALIAGVIYTESRFRDQTSHAGAKGLMQLLPSTADDIARKSGGTAFVQGDLRTRRSTSPTVVLPALPAAALRRQRVLAIAAYNAGEGRVDKWIFDAPPQGRGVRPRAPHPVPRDAPLRPAGARRPRALREEYGRELGL